MFNNINELDDALYGLLEKGFVEIELYANLEVVGLAPTPRTRIDCPP